MKLITVKLKEYFMSGWIEAGGEAPDFTLTACNGSDITLSSLRGQAIVLFFYPKDDTPG